MAKISFMKKFKFITFILVLTILLGAVAGCKKPPQADSHVVGDMINYVDDVYHEVYIEQGMTDSDKGLVVGLHDSAMKILKSADAIYDGQTEVGIFNGKIMGLPNKALGSTNNVLTIVKGEKQYTLKYMYVTRAIRNVNDLSLNRNEFPSAPWINPSNPESGGPDGLAKYTPYIFEMDMGENSYTAGKRVPTIEVDGYYVLAADIDVGSDAYMGPPGQKMKNVICSGHADYRVNATFLAKTDVGFTGTFDGRGHTISNLTTWLGGVFGYINHGTIKNTAFNNVCNYWQSPDKHFFADYLNEAKFENLYVKLRQQGQDNGSYNPNNPGGTSYYEYWSNIFGDGTAHVKDCVLESFILEGETGQNTNYMQFVNSSAGSTYQNVHCVGSSPLALASMSFTENIKIMATAKEMEEIFGPYIDEENGFGGVLYGDVFDYMEEAGIWNKYVHIVDAVKSSFNITKVCFVEAMPGVEMYNGGRPEQIMAKFYNEMKTDTETVQKFMDTGYWNFDATTGALTWKTV